ncbi:hypothetical protein L2D08_22390 [Domibacillus sp. PGB-M46]|uniref:hypothetical protein n=1 Tax=Domibacillus sp. PGB-M46 TaxID=2910255 RepID=UPI001F56B249|nr:hypothetical protein [Domibacillus sp. PGB-M46]MCI2257074.1 hypothetical protein [Domibacillus sp. PGB-M46]
MSKQDRQDLAAAKAATAKYQDIENAYADGYVHEDPYAGIEAGGMGIHLTRFDISGDTVLDPTQPENLLYEPQKDDSYKLIGIEYHVDASQVNPETDAAPSIFGQQLDGTMLNHHLDPSKMTCEDINDRANRHYDLHVWVWEHNPSGLFSMWNPNVTDKSAQ